MADLQVCYFCGSGPDDDIGEYAVVPPALEPDEQQSVALCPDCREKLTSVMDPVVDAAEAYARKNAGAGGARDDGDAPAGSRAGEPAAGPGDGRAGERGDAAAGVSGADSGHGDAGAASDDAVHPSSPGDVEVDGEDGVTVDPADVGSGSAAGGGGSAPGGGSAGGTGGKPGDGTDAGADIMGGGDEGVGGDEGGNDVPAESAAVRDQPHADDELVGRSNEAYNKTLRLLQNREFPVERHEIEQVAASAYQLDPQEVSDAIDALIRKGLLTQEGAQLVRS